MQTESAATANSTKLFGTAKHVALYLRPLSRCGAVGGAPPRRALYHTHACANLEGIAVAKDSSPPEMCVLRGLVLGETTVQTQEIARRFPEFGLHLQTRQTACRSPSATHTTVPLTLANFLSASTPPPCRPLSCKSMKKRVIYESTTNPECKPRTRTLSQCAREDRLPCWCHTAWT